MKTLDEVIKAYECCNHDDKCEDCPYNGITCTLERNTDALYYLKKYQTEQKILSDSKEHYEYWENKYYAELEKNEPLSWDELQTMEGKPVWVESHGDITEYTGWAIVKNIKPNDRINFILSRYENDMFLDLEIGVLKSGIGADWQAYRKEK